MAQVGHADHKMTYSVYAQLQRNLPREYGSKVDEIIGGSLWHQAGGCAKRPVVLRGRLAVTLRCGDAPTCGLSLLLLVQLSSERARHALRQDCSFAKQQDSPPALPVVV